LPRGTAVKLKNYKESRDEVQKHYIEDWTREEYSYPTYFEGDIYHMVERRDSTGLEIYKNEPALLQSNIEPKNFIIFPNFKSANPSAYKTKRGSFERKKSYHGS